MTLRISCLETVLIEGTSSSLENHRGLNFDNVMPSLGNIVLKMRILTFFPLSQCKTGFAGNGVHCGRDEDLDGYPDEQQLCKDTFCKKV